MLYKAFISKILQKIITYSNNAFLVSYSLSIPLLLKCIETSLNSVCIVFKCYLNGCRLFIDSGILERIALLNSLTIEI